MLLKFTVIAEYWANEKGLCRKVEAANGEEAADLVIAEVTAALKADRAQRHEQARQRGWGVPEEYDEPEEENDDDDDEQEEDMIRIWAVLPGWIDPVFLRD